MRLVDQQNAEDYLRETVAWRPTSRWSCANWPAASRTWCCWSSGPIGPATTSCSSRPGRNCAPARPGFPASSAPGARPTCCGSAGGCSSGASQAAAGERLVAQTPRILFEDRDNYLFAMTAAPRPTPGKKTCSPAGPIRPWRRLADGCWARCTPGAGAIRTSPGRSATARCSTNCGSIPTIARWRRRATTPAPLERLIESLAAQLVLAGACRLQPQEPAAVFAAD